MYCISKCGVKYFICLLFLRLYAFYGPTNFIQHIIDYFEDIFTFKYFLGNRKINKFKLLLKFKVNMSEL